MSREIETLQNAVNSNYNIVAITGAGISTPAGINDMEHLNFVATIQMMSETILKTQPKHYYKIARKGFLDALFINGATVTHKKLAQLEHTGRLRGIITTNIDCLHSIAGNQNVAEIQGSFGINKCLKCGREYNDFNIWNKGNSPQCPDCGGSICPFPVYSHVGVYPPAASAAKYWISQADLILVIASKGMYGGVYFQYRKATAKIIQINPKRTEFDGIASLNIHKKADEVFEQLVCDSK